MGWSGRGTEAPRGELGLPHEEAQPVRVVEPAARVHLHVLADRVEAHPLQRL